MLGTDKVRILPSGAWPSPINFGRISEEVQKAAEIARVGGIRLLIEMNLLAMSVRT